VRPVVVAGAAVCTELAVTQGVAVRRVVVAGAAVCRQLAVTQGVAVRPVVVVPPASKEVVPVAPPGALRLGCPALGTCRVLLGWVRHYLEADSHRRLLLAELRRIRWVIHSRRG
jgi:hypothetical protein